MSVTSSPEPMELDPTPATSIIPSDLSVDWPTEEEQDLIFSLRQVNVPEREPTRTKVLGFATQDQLTVGENNRQHPSYSEEDVLYKTNSIKSHQVTSALRCHPNNLSSFAQTNPPTTQQQSTENSTHKNACSTSHPTTQPSHDLPKATSIEQNRATLPHSNDTDPLCFQSEPKMSPIELNNVTERMSASGDSEQNNDSKTADCGACKSTERNSSPVFINGSQHYNPNALLSDQNERFTGTQTLDTPPLSSSTPEENTTEPEPLSQGVQHEQEQEQTSKQPISEVSRKEIENKNPNFDLETPPDDISLQAHLLISPREDLTEEQNRHTSDDTCPDEEEVDEPPGCDPPRDSSPIEGLSSNHSVVESESFEKEILSNELLTPTHTTEVETFSTNLPDDPCAVKNSEEDKDSFITSLTSELKECIYHPPLDLKTNMHIKRCEDIIAMQQLLQKKSRELQVVVGQMEKKFLIQQSSTFLTFARDRHHSQLPSNPSHTHSHLLKQTQSRELEKQARFYKAALKNCEDSMQTGYETESSSDDECYVNSTNLGGPKRRRLTQLHHKWLSDRVEIGVSWNWLDLQISQIETELTSVNQRLEELNYHRVLDKGNDLEETSSRCIPYPHTPTSRVIHKTISNKPSSMTNILQSSPHYHSILSLRDSIPSTLLLHDSLMSISTKDLPFDSKDLKKLEQTLSHNKSLNLCPTRKSVNSISKKIGHRPKLNSRSSSFVPRFGSVSVAEMSHSKSGKNKPLLSGGMRHRRARSYDTTSIIIPGSSLPRQEKPSLKEIVIPGWREFIAGEDTSSIEDGDYEDNDFTYETLHSKYEEGEKQNYLNAMHLSSASSKKLKRLLISPDTLKVYSASYGWSARKFPLSSDECDFEDTSTRQSSKTTESNSPIEDSVFSTPHCTDQQ